MVDPNTRRISPMCEETHGSLLSRARDGDKGAWDELVERMSPLVWSVVRSFRLDPATTADVVQIVWLRLLENFDAIRDPERLPGWLAITSRREALAAVKHRKKVVPTDLADDLEDPDAAVEVTIDLEDDFAEVRRAFDRLSESDQRVLRLTVLQPELPYTVVAELLDRPIGSIGPTRRRALRRLERAMGRPEHHSVRV